MGEVEDVVLLAILAILAILAKRVESEQICFYLNPCASALMYVLQP